MKVIASGHSLLHTEVVAGTHRHRLIYTRVRYVVLAIFYHRLSQTWDGMSPWQEIGNMECSLMITVFATHDYGRLFIFMFILIEKTSDSLGYRFGF